MPGAPPPTTRVTFGTIFNSLLYNTTAGDKGVVLGLNPRIGDMTIVIWAASGVTGITPGCTDNSPDGLGTYTLVATGLEAASVDKVAILIRNAPFASTTAVTVTTTGQSASTGGGLVVLQVLGIGGGGLGAVRQVQNVDNHAASGTPGMTFTNGVGGTSLLVMALLWTSATIATAPTGWSTTSVGSYTTPTQTLRTVYRPGGGVGATFSYGTVAAATWGLVACEIAPPVPAVQESYGPATMRAATMMQAFDEEPVVGRRLLLPRRKLWRPSIVVPELRFA